MTGPVNGRSERELRELLPFYVNGSLADEELAAVEDYLAHSEAAREETAYLELLRKSVKAQPQVNSPGELGLKRLQKQLSDEATTATQRGERASELANSAQQSARGVPVWWRNLAVAACLALVVLGAVSIGGLPGDRGEVGLAGGESDAVIQVTFKPEATEQVIRALLLEIGASITQGPSALGIYRLSLTAQIDDAAISTALQQLRGRSDLVESAERE